MLHRLHGNFLRARSGDDDHRHVRHGGFDRVEKLQTSVAEDIEIAQYDVDALVRELGRQFFTRGRFDEQELRILTEGIADEFAIHPIFVDIQNSDVFTGRGFDHCSQG